MKQANKTKDTNAFSKIDDEYNASHVCCSMREFINSKRLQSLNANISSIQIRTTKTERIF